MEAPGSLSDGFKTKVFPVAMARGNIQRGIIAGKLNLPSSNIREDKKWRKGRRREEEGRTYGVIPAQTPNG
jgi:hypothetical protein